MVLHNVSEPSQIPPISDSKAVRQNNTTNQSQSKGSGSEDRLGRWMKNWERPRDAPGRIAFHKSEVNKNLINNLEKFLGPQSGEPREAGSLSQDQTSGLEGGTRKVLVTLCGKTVDMPFLSSKGLAVVGVEGIRTAIEEFCEEHPEIPLERQAQKAEGDFQVFSAPRLSLLCGDFFALSPATAGTFDLCLDRAALVAVHPSLREKYVAVLARVLKKGARVLLVGLNYKQEEMDGPPYSLDQREVERLFGESYEIDLLTSDDVLADYPRFVEKGCTNLREETYLVVKTV